MATKDYFSGTDIPIDGYPASYYTQGLKEYSGQGSAASNLSNLSNARQGTPGGKLPNPDFNPASLGGGILSGGLSQPLGKISQVQSVGTPAQFLDILEAAKRKLIKGLIEDSGGDHIFPEGWYGALRDLVREYDPRWADWYQEMSELRNGGRSPHSNTSLRQQILEQCAGQARNY